MSSSPLTATPSTLLPAKSKNPPPHHHPLLSYLHHCTSLRALAQLHAVAVKAGLQGHPAFVTRLFTLCTEQGAAPAHLAYARQVFDRIPHPGDVVWYNTLLRGMDGECVISYNAMITAAVRSSRPGEALVLFREMQAKGLKPTSVTLISVLSACALLGALELGRWIHEYIRKMRLDSLVKVNTALIDMYAKCGSLEDAIGVFQEMESRDKQAWSVMIVSYANHGYGREAISMFEDMKKQGIKPDDVTFLGVLYACSHSGMHHVKFGRVVMKLWYDL
ncbi:hypothetical protein E2562_019014 [Oryza meyeriana var. granulata]|uniref:Pentacotripeptide-repeat region of PRORP domain-containing protein n=1 Tax=Oryza meyeriana var. granulata TaxID=110450 RepID=A0A6G1DK24_9ORYZ|nr:hypothetical protein E2562_019014 [Oryza meyeriana var. granulata]